MAQKNPFVYGEVVFGQSYLPRTEIESKLADNIVSGQNTVVYGERRVGKTSLVHNVCKSLKGYNLVVADFLLCSDSSEIAIQIGKAVLEVSKKEPFLHHVLRALSHLRPTMGLDPNSGNANFSFSIDSSIANDPSCVEAALDGINELSKRRKIVALFDEFQAVSKSDPSSKTIAAMRSKIQFHNGFAYVFSGSDRTSMAQIFTDPDSPFYKSAQVMSLESPDPDRFWAFIKKRFKKGGLVFQEDLRSAMERMEIRTPGEIQETCNYVWHIAKSSGSSQAKADDVLSAMQTIVKTEADSFEKIYESLSIAQRKLIRGIAFIGGEAVYSIDFQNHTGLRASGTITRALGQLRKQSLVRKTVNGWRLENPYFKYWINSVV